MLVNRRTYRVKPGQMDELVALIRAAIDGYTSYTHEYRMYTSETGDLNVLAVEWELDSFEEYGRLWQGWYESPEFVTFMDKFVTLTEPGSTNHLWWKV